jgi:hypothetical protein
LPIRRWYANPLKISLILGRRTQPLRLAIPARHAKVEAKGYTVYDHSFNSLTHD